MSHSLTPLLLCHFSPLRQLNHTSIKFPHSHSKLASIQMQMCMEYVSKLAIKYCYYVFAMHSAINWCGCDHPFVRSFVHSKWKERYAECVTKGPFICVAVISRNKAIIIIYSIRWHLFSSAWIFNSIVHFTIIKMSTPPHSSLWR